MGSWFVVVGGCFSWTIKRGERQGGARAPMTTAVEYDTSELSRLSALNGRYEEHKGFRSYDIPLNNIHYYIHSPKDVRACFPVT
jgi:hypothetical protein